MTTTRELTPDQRTVHEWVRRMAQAEYIVEATLKRYGGGRECSAEDVVFHRLKACFPAELVTAWALAASGT